MGKDLQALVRECVAAGQSNGLNTDLVERFCVTHSLNRTGFYYTFAKHVALEFANGELSYSDGDLAMNDLMIFSELEAGKFATEIFSAFDAGEYYRPEDPPGTIPWQKYTLPAVMELLNNEGLVPHA